jgi:putative transcriptional regulator
MSALGKELLEGAREARRFARGETTKGFVVHIPSDVDVRAIRHKLGLTQKSFAESFGFGFDAVRDWEQGRRHPVAAARAFLLVIDKAPDLVLETLRHAA